MEMKEPEEQIKKQKLEFHRLPPVQLAHVAAILNEGEKKHSAHGKYTYMEYDPIVYYNAIMRHLQKIRMGEVVDPEYGLLLARSMTKNQLIFGDEQYLKEERLD